MMEFKCRLLMGIFQLLLHMGKCSCNFCNPRILIFIYLKSHVVHWVRCCLCSMHGIVSLFCLFCLAPSIFHIKESVMLAYLTICYSQHQHTVMSCITRVVLFSTNQLLWKGARIVENNWQMTILGGVLVNC